jgi:hypothetical protein
MKFQSFNQRGRICSPSILINLTRSEVTAANPAAL